jgi:sugar phosphate isomerase/epimerase
MTLKVGLSTSIFRYPSDVDTEILSIFPIAKQFNIDTIEFVVRKSSILWLINHKKQFKKLSEDYTIFIHPYDIELHKLDEQIGDIKNLIQLCVDLNFNRMIIHPGYKEIFNNFSSLKELSQKTAKMNIKLFIENGYKNGESLRTADEILNFFEKIRHNDINNVFLALDIWRLSKVYEGTDKFESELIKILKLHLLKHIHFSDGRKMMNNSFALGDGELNISNILNILKFFNGYLIIEVDTLEDAIKSIKFLQKTGYSL